MRHRPWKTRLADMKEAISRIISYCSGLSSETDLFKTPEKFDACIRNFQILGDAAARIPPSIRKEIKGIPWREITATRNILVHEYFGVSPSIIWKTVTKDLPHLAFVLDEALAKFSEPVHPWKLCPPGEHYVRQATVQEHVRDGSVVRSHLRRDHCRESQNSTKNILTAHEAADMAELFPLTDQPLGSALGFGKRETEFDDLIRGWTEYWNHVLNPSPSLDPMIVKALIASESSFDANAGKGKKSAIGLMQLMPDTIRYLNGERNELEDHIFEFDSQDIFDAGLNISAGIRWLFRKRELAAHRLKRDATWEEAVSEYKDYLRRVLKNPKVSQKGMNIFRENLEKLRGK